MRHYFRLPRTQADTLARVEQAIQTMFGVVGVARAEPTLIMETDEYIILNVAAESADTVKRALSVEGFTFDDSPLLVFLT